MKFSHFKILLVVSIAVLLMLPFAACAPEEEPEEEPEEVEEVDEDEDEDEAFQFEEEYELRLGTVVSPPHPWIDMAEFFADELEARTDGHVTVNISHSGAIGDDEEMIDEMRIGTVDFVIGGASNAIPFIPEYEVTGFPYLFEDYDHFNRTFEEGSPVFEEFRDIHEERAAGFQVIAFSGGGTRVTSTSFGPVSEPADVQGKDMRLPAAPSRVEIWEEFGAVATTLPWGDIYSALEAGMIEMFESSISGYYGSALYEVAPYMNLTNHQIMLTHFSMSDHTRNELPDEAIQIIEEVAAEAGELGTQRGIENDEELLEELEEEYGVEVNRDVDIDAFIEVSEPLHDRLAEDYEVVDLLEMIRELEE